MADKQIQLGDKESDCNLVLLVDALKEIDDSSPDADENAISIDDNNGGRIIL